MNEALIDKAVNASQRFLERKGYEVICTELDEDSGCRYIVYTDPKTEALVFAEVTVDTEPLTQAEACSAERRALWEKFALAYLGFNPPPNDTEVRFDNITVLAFSADRALLRHHINAMGAPIEAN